ncbi:uncharacterized protein LOC122081546 isoform X3 [Macadamia integrifolia]|uniref:uncharacterized protein LOC122081546 isoform X3 n=1 Tax=Macadamia integrifolia TaxID=60698 RepID=UPI001C4E771E|nr:uncharacterized protein LOC122081546 isoform X3 [Macadamia integrifolia]
MDLGTMVRLLHCDLVITGSSRKTASAQSGCKAAYITTLPRPCNGGSLVHWSHICGSCKAEIKAATKANSQTVLGSLLYLFTWLSWIRSLIETIICGSHRYIIPDSQDRQRLSLPFQYCTVCKVRCEVI